MLGFSLTSDGDIGDVLPGSPADRAGIIQGMKLVAVNQRAWTVKLLRAAVAAAATNTAPVTLLAVNQGYYETYPLNYHGGEKYPCLERVASKPDLLDAILQPLTKEPSTNQPATK